MQFVSQNTLFTTKLTKVGKCSIFSIANCFKKQKMNI